MEDVDDPDQLAVAVDASVLIDLAKAGRLENLRELFGIVAVPALVHREIKPGYATSRPILTAPWLRRIAAEELEDLELINDLHRTWGSKPPKNAGEAELIALCRRHGWVAIMEDREGREGAKRLGVHSVRLTTCAIAAAACGAMTPDRAWGLHAPYHRDHLHPVIGTTIADRPRFDHATETVGRLHQTHDHAPWPELLNHPAIAPGTLDQMVHRLRDYDPDRQAGTDHGRAAI